MSTALMAALRESCGYLRDAGYHETARLLVAAADEIERLREHLHAHRTTHGSASRPQSKCLVEGGVDRDRSPLPPERRSSGAIR